MSSTLSFHMLPADDGDCILLQAVSGSGEQVTILVDGGRGRSYPSWKPHLQELLGTRQVVDLLVVTHIDADHIEGIIKFFEDQSLTIEVSEVWFNGHRQVLSALRHPDDIETFDAKHADILSKILDHREVAWNSVAAGGPISRDNAPGPHALGPIAITVVTPSRENLAAVSSQWNALMAQIGRAESEVESEELERFGAISLDVEGLSKTPDVRDTAKANGSSIGLLIEVFGRRILLAADSHADDMAAGLRLLGISPEAPALVDIMKISHHGAPKNTSKDLLSLVQADYYAFSTNGRHRDRPSPAVVAKILKSNAKNKTLSFNYASSASAAWDNDALKAEYSYFVSVSPEDRSGQWSLVLAG